MGSFKDDLEILKCYKSSFNSNFSAKNSGFSEVELFILLSLMFSNLPNQNHLSSIVKLTAKTRKFFQSKSRYSNHPHNPPNDYEVVLLIIILNNTFYDKKSRIIKKWYVGHHNLLQSQM